MHAQNIQVLAHTRFLFHIMLTVKSCVYIYLSHDIASRSDIRPCNRIDKPLAVYRFSGTVMTPIITLRKIRGNLEVFKPKKAIFKYF